MNTTVLMVVRQTAPGEYYVRLPYGSHKQGRYYIAWDAPLEPGQMYHVTHEGKFKLNEPARVIRIEPALDV